MQDWWGWWGCSLLLDDLHVVPSVMVIGVMTSNRGNRVKGVLESD